MRRLGDPCIHISDIGSTNNYLAERLQSEYLAEGTAILTYHQRAGKGQFSRVWEMQSGKDVAISYLLRPDLTHRSLFTLNKSIGLGLYDMLTDMGLPDVKLKWPNDVMVQGEKIAGVLIEPTWSGRSCKHVIVGIGFNINSTTDSYPFSAVSLREASGRTWELGDVVDRMHRALTSVYQEFCDTKEEWISQRYDSSLLGIGEELMVKGFEDQFCAKLEGVDKQGRLVLVNESGVSSFANGEVSVDYSGVV